MVRRRCAEHLSDPAVHDDAAEGNFRGGNDRRRRVFQAVFQHYSAQSIPILVVVAIGAITGAWSDLQGPLTYISSRENYTLTMAVSMLSTDTSLNIDNVPATMAACMYLLIPPCLLFIFGQKYFIESVVMSGIKG